MPRMSSFRRHLGLVAVAYNPGFDDISSNPYGSNRLFPTRKELGVDRGTKYIPFDTCFADSTDFLASERLG